MGNFFNYKIATLKKMSTDLSTNTDTNTEYNVRLIPNFVAGSGGLNFQGKISATRNA